MQYSIVGTTTSAQQAVLDKLGNYERTVGFKYNTDGRTTFDDRLLELLKFKEKFSHCNAPGSKDGDYYSCSNLRTSYKKKKQGGKPTRSVNLTDVKIQQLQDAGFQWVAVRIKKSTFDERFDELMAYKEQFGHCNVPGNRSESNQYVSLGRWCIDLRSSLKKMNQGEKGHINLVSDERKIQRLDDLGFKWNLSSLCPVDLQFSE